MLNIWLEQNRIGHNLMQCFNSLSNKEQIKYQEDSYLNSLLSYYPIWLFSRLSQNTFISTFSAMTGKWNYVQHLLPKAFYFKNTFSSSTAHSYRTLFLSYGLFIQLSQQSQTPLLIQTCQGQGWNRWQIDQLLKLCLLPFI